MAKKRAKLADLLNDLTFKVLYDKYKLIAQNRFEWCGLEEIGVDPKHVEKYLFSYGKAIFYRPTGLNYMVLEAQDGVGVNVHGEPLSYNAVGFNHHERVDADDCVIIENNRSRIATDPFIMFYANKLTEAERTTDVNIKACKTPVVFACDDKDVLTFKRIFSMVDGNVPAVYADKGINLDAIQTFDTKVKFLGNDLMDYKKSVENELLTFLGFNNLAVDKKERVNVSEAESNNDVIESFYDLQYEARLLACERINEKYGLNISVKKKSFQQGGVESVENKPLQHDPNNR